MKALRAQIETLIKRNATHRKGFQLQDVTPEFILKQAQLELDELKEKPGDPSEMADLIAILVHYNIRQGWTTEYIEAIALTKLNERFTLTQD